MYTYGELQRILHGLSATGEWHNFCTFYYCVVVSLNVLLLNSSNVVPICLK